MARTRAGSSTCDERTWSRGILYLPVPRTAMRLIQMAGGKSWGLSSKVLPATASVSPSTISIRSEFATETVPQISTWAAGSGFFGISHP